MSNTIREDVVSISFNVENNPFAELTNSVNSMRNAVTGGVGGAEDSLQNLARSTQDLNNNMQDTTDTANRADKSFTDMLRSIRDIAKAKIGNGLQTLREIPDRARSGFERLRSSVERIRNIRLSDIGKALDRGLGRAITACINGATKLAAGLKKAAGVVFNKVVSGVKNIAKYAGQAALNLAKISFKGLMAGAGAAATAVGGIVAASVKAYADYEQLVGGVETLFKDSAPEIQKYANDAYKTAGLSANKYMETVTSFSASIIQSVGGDTKKAAEMSNMAISDMSDNANKMGTSMDSIIETYQSLAKGNYGMLDNLKLGFGGTKSEMQRLIKEAAKLDSSIDSNSLSYANMVKAIHVIQNEMGITGTTQKEAEKTISGSLSALKSSWGNMLTALVVGGDSFDQCIDNLVQSATTFAKNIIPVIKKALSGVADLINELAPMIAAEIPSLINDVLPSLVNAGIAMVQSLITAVQSNIGQLASTAIQVATSFATFFLQALPQIVLAGVQLISQLASGIAQQLPTLVPMAIEAIQTIVTGLTSCLDSLVETGIQLVKGLTDGFIANLPMITTAALELLIGITDSILNNLQLIINAGLELINALTSGLLQHLPAIINAGLELLMGILNGLISNIDLLVNGALQLVLALAQGLLQALPQILQAAMQLVFGLVGGLLNNITTIVQAGFQLIMGLIQGIVQMMPQITLMAVQLIIQLVMGLVDNLPMIIEGAAQLIVALAVGLVQAIPQLIAAIPQIISAIIDGLMSVDWIQVGKDLIGGVWNGVKSLFGGGKENGKQAVNSVASGINSNSYTATAAGTNLANSTTNSLKLNNTAISGYGASGGSSLAFGISGSTGTATTAAANLASSTKNSLQLGDTTNIGLNAASGLAIGITSNTGTATAAAGNMSNQVKKAADTDVKVNVEADTKGISNTKKAVTGLVKTTQAQLRQLKPIFASNFTAAVAVATAQMARLNNAVKAGTTATLTTVRMCTMNIRTAIASCNLYSAGANMMSGLNQGMASMRGTIIATARSIAASAAATINKELDIHSPSRVTMLSGEFTGQGLAVGMQNMRTDVTKSAQGLSRTAATEIKPSVHSYTPSSSTISNSRSNQTNNFNPQFTLNMNGASATETNKRKVKQWVKESIQETFESMERINPNLCEV